MSEPGPENPVLVLADGTPDWDAIEFDVLCSRCGYNLRTLTRPKCTECGLDFEWQRVLDRAAFRSDFLFEHHWQSRPVQSWLLTVWRSLRPKPFWGGVSIHEDVRAAPLIAMLFMSVMTSFVFLHGSAWVMSRAIYRVVGTKQRLTYVLGTKQRLPYTPPRIQVLFSKLAFRLSELAHQPLMEGWNSVLWRALAVATPFVGALVLLFALRQTMRRYRIRFIQVLRVVAYSATPVALWCALAYLATFFVLPT